MKKALLKIIPTVFVITCSLIAHAQAGSSSDQADGSSIKAPKDVMDIIKKSNHMSLYQGEDSKGSIKLVITDKQGRIRKREMNILRKDIGEGDNNQKYFVYFKEPTDVLFKHPIQYWS